MKWCLPAFATSLVVFLLLFAAIDSRRADLDAEGGSSEPASSFGARADSGESRIESVAAILPHPGPPSVVRAMTPPESEAFERRLEGEVLVLLRERRDFLTHRQKFSRARLESITYDFTRIQVPREHAEVADSALLVREKSARGDAQRLLLVRRTPEGILEVLEGAQWSAARAFAGRFEKTLDQLPAAPENLVRQRSTGPFYEQMVAESLTEPLEARAQRLSIENAFSRVMPNVSSFTIAVVEDLETLPGEIDSAVELHASGSFVNASGLRLRVPVRYDVDSGELQVLYGGEWLLADAWASRIQVHLGPARDGSALPAIEEGWEARWSLKKQSG